MNLLEITPADIERWKKGLELHEQTERDKAVRKLIREDGFHVRIVSYLSANYQIPTPTEAEIIAYLKASEVPPSQWHSAAQEWARKHKGEEIWEYRRCSGEWRRTNSIELGDGRISFLIHRLRADYGVTERYRDVVSDFQGLLEIIRKTQGKEVCRWTYFWQFGQKLYETSCGHRCQSIEFGKYCKHCGKPIMEIANDTNTPV